MKNKIYYINKDLTNIEKANKFFSTFKRIYNEDTGETLIEAVVKKSDNALGLYNYKINKFFYLDLDTFKGTIEKPKNYYKVKWKYKNNYENIYENDYHICAECEHKLKGVIKHYGN